MHYAYDPEIKKCLSVSISIFIDAVPPVTYRFCLVLPLFVNYFNEIPVLRSSGAGSLTSSISSKSMFYIIGAQVAFSSTENASVFVASIIAGFLVRKNFLWARQWIRVPKIVASVTDK